VMRAGSPPRVRTHSWPWKRLELIDEHRCGRRGSSAAARLIRPLPSLHTSTLDHWTQSTGTSLPFPVSGSAPTTSSCAQCEGAFFSPLFKKEAGPCLHSLTRSLWVVAQPSSSVGSRALDWTWGRDPTNTLLHVISVFPPKGDRLPFDASARNSRGSQTGLSGVVGW
jgi:hypothetical protein